MSQTIFEHETFQIYASHSTACDNVLGKACLCGDVSRFQYLRNVWDNLKNYKRIWNAKKSALGILLVHRKWSNFEKGSTCCHICNSRLITVVEFRAKISYVSNSNELEHWFYNINLIIISVMIFLLWLNCKNSWIARESQMLLSKVSVVCS